MPKQVLDVGNCAYDHGSLKSLIERNFDAKVLQSHGPRDTLKMLREQTFALVVINRKLDRDHSDGIDILRDLKTDEQLKDLPVMMLSNYEDAQAAAEAEGAVPGFGKRDLGKETTLKKLEPFLG
ncbi:response regulator [Blastopirellula marina]|uniref:Response regulator n=1 Tax=Blastopirellula marina TaxID=124 RepID=A0A2S8FXX0_9BACT|nr:MULTISPECIES: response regulator [Pirellulaceae]PQO37025.1 response regulator [Blastopirellula marina]RCS53740.1 response regulator [Bremerella cremea]